MSKRKTNRKKSRSGKNRSPLTAHSRSGKQLHPPFAQLGDKIVFSSWANDRMPDMLWAVIIRGILDQEFAISQFRRILKFVGNHKKRESLFDLTHTGIAQYEPELRREFISHILADPTTARALTILKLFEALPAREDWLAQLPQTNQILICL